MRVSFQCSRKRSQEKEEKKKKDTNSTRTRHGVSGYGAGVDCHAKIEKKKFAGAAAAVGRRWCPGEKHSPCGDDGDREAGIAAVNDYQESKSRRAKWAAKCGGGAASAVASRRLGGVSDGPGQTKPLGMACARHSATLSVNFVDRVAASQP